MTIVVLFCTVVMLGALALAVCLHIAHTRRDAALHEQSRRQFDQPLEPANVAVIPAQRATFDAHCRDALAVANGVNA